MKWEKNRKCEKFYDTAVNEKLKQYQKKKYMNILG